MPAIICLLSLLDCILRSSQLSFDEAELIFYLPDFLKWFIMSRKCGLMFSRYCSIVSCSSPSLLYLLCLSSGGPEIFSGLWSLSMLGGRGFLGSWSMRECAFFWSFSGSLGGGGSGFSGSCSGCGRWWCFEWAF